MKKEQLIGIISKYRKLSEAASKERKQDKAQEMEEFADFVEENMDLYQDDAYQRETELWEDYEAVSTGSSPFEDAFSDGDNDD
jgi:hypothetical protein